MGLGGEKNMSFCVLCNHVKKMKYKRLQKVKYPVYIYTFLMKSLQPSLYFLLYTMEEFTHNKNRRVDNPQLQQLSR